MTSDVGIHDRFFKTKLGLSKPLGEVLKAFLPPSVADRLDAGSLVFLPTESMGEALGGSFMDLAFSARFDGVECRVQIIVEHKSAPDAGTYFQVAHYATGLWLRSLREGKSPHPVLPVLFYHGVRPWDLPERLSDLLGTPSFLKGGIPDFSLTMIDLGRIEDEEIRRRVLDLDGVLALLALKYIFGDPQVFLRVLFREVRARNAAYDIMKPELAYIAGYRGINRPEGLKTLLDPILAEEGMAANIVDEWIEQGIEQGIEKEKNLVVKNLLRQGLLTEEQIAAVVGVDPSRVREIRDGNG